jgi:hypothetical protein
MSNNRVISYGDLKVTLTSFFSPVWSDVDSGAKRNGAFWHPLPQGDLRALGSVVIPHHGNIVAQWAALLVGDDPNNRPPGETRPAVMRPVGYEHVWDDTDSGSKYDASVWRPIPPQDYIALGDVATPGHGKPDLDRVWCLRNDLVRDGEYDEKENSIWDDQGSDGKYDGSFWNVYPRKGDKDSAGDHIPVLAGTFLCSKSYATPGRNEVLPSVPALYVPREDKPFSPRPPEIPAGGPVPATKQTFDSTEQSAVTLPFTSFFSPADQGCLSLIADPFCTVRKKVSWVVLEKFPNYQSTSYTQTQSITTGLKKTASQTTEHTAAVSISSEVGYGLSKWSVNLSYQFSFSQSNSVEEIMERTVSKTITVAPHTVAIAWGKQVVMQAVRSDGRRIEGEIGFNATDEVAVTEIPVKT